MAEPAAGDRIRAARKRGGMTQKELAEKLGIGLGKMERLESGELDPAPHLKAVEAHTGEPLAESADHGSGGKPTAGGGSTPVEPEPPRPAPRIEQLTDELTRMERERTRLRQNLADVREQLVAREKRARELEDAITQLQGAASSLLDQMRALGVVTGQADGDAAPERVQIGR